MKKTKLSFLILSISLLVACGSKTPHSWTSPDLQKPSAQDTLMVLIMDQPNVINQDDIADDFEKESGTTNEIFINKCSEYMNSYFPKSGLPFENVKINWIEKPTKKSSFSKQIKYDSKKIITHFEGGIYKEALSLNQPTLVIENLKSYRYQTSSYVYNQYGGGYNQISNFLNLEAQYSYYSKNQENQAFGKLYSSEGIGLYMNVGDWEDACKGLVKSLRDRMKDGRKVEIVD